MPIAAVNGVELDYLAEGSGPPLLVIGGSGGRQPTPAPLVERFTTLSYAQREQGRSSKLGRPSTMADYADDAAALIRYAGWERAHVVGISFGWRVAQHLAIGHPAAVDRLVLCCTSPGGPDHSSAPFHELGPGAALQLLDTRGTFEIGEGSFEPANDDLLAARATHDVVARLGEIAAPTLLCAGRYDGIAPLANSERMAAGIPDARLDVFDGGHAFFVQDARAWPAIVDFLEARA